MLILQEKFNYKDINPAAWPHPRPAESEPPEGGHVHGDPHQQVAGLGAESYEMTPELKLGKQRLR